jgi:two-component system sporulation sensor kinase B
MITALTMWIATIILGIADHKTESTRWAMGLTFFAGLAGFGVFWSGSTWMFAYAVCFGITNETYRIISSIFSGLSHYLIPYFALMFGLSYSGILNAKYQKIFSILLLVPMGITLLFFPTHDYYFNTSKEISYYYWFFSIWAVPYLLISCILQIYAYGKEDIPSKKRERFIFCLIAVPGIAVNSITTYLLAGLPVGQPGKYWRYNFFVILYMFILFLYFLVKYGVLGIKLRIEKHNLSNIMNVMDSGIKILSHSLKNEVTNISICMTNMKLSLANPDKHEGACAREIHENFQMVSASLEHLSAMMRKLQKNSVDPGQINLTKNNLSEIIATGLKYVAVLLKSKNIGIYKNVNDDIAILSDKVYLQEVFVNLFQNAAEAMNFEGELVIETILTTKGLTVVVKDNGAGINKEDLPHVIEPFFTTKETRNNFGLGLSYCYNILKKHGASLEVKSEKNIGTAVKLFFPKDKVIATPIKESIKDYCWDHKE